MITKRYEIDYKIGFGKYARVYSCHHLVTGEHYAMKIFRDKKAFESECAVFHVLCAHDLVHRQSNIQLPSFPSFPSFQSIRGPSNQQSQQQLNFHPHIVTCYEAEWVDSEHKGYMICELAQHDLFHEMYECSKPLSNFTKLMFLFQVALAIQYIHSKGYVHGDIRPENIVVFDNHSSPSSSSTESSSFSGSFSSSKLVKLIDFNLCKKNQVHRGWVGTLEYLAPECVRNKLISYALDIWNLGTLAYELFFGRCPFVQLKPGFNNQTLFFPRWKTLPITNPKHVAGAKFRSQHKLVSLNENILAFCSRQIPPIPSIPPIPPNSVVSKQPSTWKVNASILKEQKERKKKKDINDQVAHDVLNKPLVFPIGTPTILIDFITPMLNRDPVKRPTISHVLQHQLLGAFFEPFNLFKPLNRADRLNH